MSNEAIATLVGLVIANWVSIGPIVYKAIRLAWTKSIEWQQMLNDINLIKSRLDDVENDINAAHLKIRNISKQ